MKNSFKFISVIIAILLLAVSALLVSCNGNKGSDETTVSETSAAETSEETKADETTVAETVEEVTTEEETTEEVTTELQWESYPEVSSNVDKTASHTVDYTQWTATDMIGRTVSTNTEVGEVNGEKIIAMFYWTWHGNFANNTKPYNVQLILDQYEDMDEATSALWSNNTPANAYHFWDEPIWGYYHGNDEWVIRKQCEMLASAGVDVLFFDNTNGAYTWLDTALKVMKVFSQAMKEGVDAPKVSFMLPFGATSGATSQLNELYNEIYSKGLYEETWFIMDEKPMLMGYASAAPSSEIKNFFTFRANVAGYRTTQAKRGSNEWGWLSIFPQALFYDKSGKLEQTTVGVSLNANTETLACPYPMNWPDAMGRTYTSKGFDSRPNALLYGACFGEQFENAIAADPEIIFVTGWNEWVAMKLTSWTGTSYTKAFVDEYCDEYSRDIEPSNGELKDSYYYQLVDYVRQFKGANAIEVASSAKLIDLNGGFGQWENVSPAYNDYFGMTNRDCKGYVGTHYTNDTARNDIYDAKVARDYENLYFMVRTVDDLTPYTDEYWMRLYIDTVDGGSKNWETFEYIINRTSPKSETVTTLERFTGNGFETEVVCEVEYTVKGNYMVIKVPKSALGIEGYDFTFNFKWTDNTKENGSIMDWYSNGDVAPIGRFKYCYTTSAKAEYVEPIQVSGYSLMNLTDGKVAADVLYKDKTTVNTSVSEKGLGFDTSADGTVVFTYENSSPKPVSSVFTYVRITYKATDADGAAKVAFAGCAGIKGKYATLSDGSPVELICDGEEHTAEFNIGTQSATKLGGYYEYLRLDFSELNGHIDISSVQLLREEDLNK